MIRLLSAVLLIAVSPAAAQIPMPTVPPPPPPVTVSPLPTQPNFGGLPAPFPPPSLDGTRVILLPRGKAVHVPANPPGRNNFSDRIETCIHAGSAAGIGPNRLREFSAGCANQ